MNRFAKLFKFALRRLSKEYAAIEARVECNGLFESGNICGFGGCWGPDAKLGIV